jgi:hypothetical protein
MKIKLNNREVSVSEAFRCLRPEAAVELTVLPERLAALQPSIRIDWSDSWSDEDLNEIHRVLGETA